MCIDLHRKVAIILSDLNTTYNLLHRFLKNIQIFSLIKFRPVEGELIRADGRTYGQTERQT